MSSTASKAIADVRDNLLLGDVSRAFSIIKAIAMEPLKVLDYQKIDRLIDEYSDLWLGFLSGARLRLAILGGYTTQPIRLALRTFLLSEGYLVDIYESEYNTYKLEVLDPASGLYSFQPEIILFATGSMNIEVFPEPGTSFDSVAEMAQALVDEYQRLWATVREQTGALVLQNNFELIEEQVFGRLEGRYPWSRSRFIQHINEKFWGLDGQGVRIVDVCGLVNRVGSSHWHDPRWYHHSKHGFDPNLTFEYGRLFAGLFRALKGTSKKCLVMDLDNTLWGGTIGDDGLQGIHLGNISAQGEAYLAFCRYIKNLKKRGVILAVSSKNHPEIAAEVFRKHPEMPLDMNDFAAFCCNWGNKSSNLRNIAQDLNIGIDSLVFVDDNPIECAEVRRMEPKVTVVEMTDDPAYFIRKLDQLHLFDQLDITDEDLRRSESYVTKRKISELHLSSSNLEEFLIDLNMIARVAASVQDDVPRIEQLFKKTNQFNLTSRQYDRTTLLRFMNEEDGFCLSFWLKDKFTDYGLVSAMVGNIKEDEILIDNWVMSCRVFFRTFEQYIFNQIKEMAKQLGCSVVRGEFIPTAKNSYVSNLFSSLGFTCESHEEGRWWVLNLVAAPELKSFIRDEQMDALKLHKGEKHEH